MTTSARMQEEVEEAQATLYERISKGASAAWSYKHFIPTALNTTLQFYTSGPQQEAWSLETALFVSLIQAAGGIRGKEDPNVSPAEQIVKVRHLIKNIETEPKSGICAPIEFEVKRRGLKGVLAEWDEKEDGSRTLPAEWQVHNESRGKASDRVVLYLHGGAFTVMNPRTHRPLTLLISKTLNARVFSLDYRLSPESIFPSALHDAVAAFQYLTEVLNIPPGNVIVAGDSAGSGLATALMLYLRDSGMPSVGGAILLSPWVDQTASMMSWETNKSIDYLSLPPPDSKTSPPHLYLGSTYADMVTNPLVSPAVADLSSLPPLLIQAGGAETLRDEITLLAQRAAIAGVDVTHEIWESGIHVSQAFVRTDISVAALKSMARWVEGQPAPKACRSAFAGADKILDEAWASRRARMERKGIKVQEEKEEVARLPTFVFEGVKQSPPVLECREGAHEALRKAVEEVNVAGPQDVTTVYSAKRNAEGQGFMSRIRGVVKL